MARSATAPDKKAGAMKEKAPPAAASGKGAAELGKKAKASPLENPLLHLSIIIAAVAVGAYFGTEHKRQGVDIVSRLLTTTGVRAPVSQPNPVPRYDAVLSRPIRVQMYANGDSSDPHAVMLDPRHVMNLPDLKRVTGKHISGCERGNCRVFDQYGYEVSSLQGLKDDQMLFLVLPDRLFVWPGFHVGHKVQLPGVESANKKPIELTTLSISPRVFAVENFFSPEDADALIASALSIKDPDFALKRSSTGTKGVEVSSLRTSENAFDTSSPVAMKLKRRVFELLGIRPYDETWADGLQVLRYNKTKAYVPHLDYLESHPAAKHDFDSAGKGTNRYATVLLYLTDVEDGGETVFVHGKPLDGSWMTESEALDMVTKQGLTKDLKKGSWEEKMTAQCRSRLAVKPKKAMAALFYSQQPDGRVDDMALHGGCPVIEGIKWAANLWVWNGPRYGYGPTDDEGPEDGHVEAEFTSAVPGVGLYWEDQLWGDMGPGLPPHRINTYKGHVWHVKKDGEVVHTFTVKTDVKDYRFKG